METNDLQKSVNRTPIKSSKKKNWNTSEQLVKDLTSRVEEYEQENENLRKKLSQVEHKYKTAEENFKYFKRRFEHEETVCKDLQESVTRLRRACTDQGKTIVGFLEEFSEKMRKLDKFGDDNHVAKLQIEQLRLTGVELSLRREVESSRREIDYLRREIDSLRREDSYIFNHLKGNGKEIGPLTIKLGMELRSHVYCTQLSSQLLELVHETSKGVDNVLDRQFVLESKLKIQGFKNGIEGLTKCLQNTSTLLHENQTLEDTETKAETLSTRLLREKLYYKELKVEQLQAKLETAKVTNHLQSNLKNCAELQTRRPLCEVTYDKNKAAEENFESTKRRFEDKETVCKDVQESVKRLRRACTDQGKTSVGFLEEFSEKMRKVDNFGDHNHVAKLQMEQLRLTGVELSLRREVESYRREIDSLRREIDSLRREDSYILNHLGMELRSHVYCWQNRGLGMLTESTQLSSQLLEFIHETSKGDDNVLDQQFVLESKLKIQGFKNGIEGLTKCLQNTTTLLHENQTLEETGRLETKEETLSTRLLREKLDCKLLKVEQSQAKLETEKDKMLEKDEKMRQKMKQLQSYR